MTGIWTIQSIFFVESSNPWVGRGGNSNDASADGVFRFGRDNGGLKSNNSFRSVLSCLNYGLKITK